jgi:hypothetical protein
MKLGTERFLFLGAQGLFRLPDDMDGIAGDNLSLEIGGFSV